MARCVKAEVPLLYPSHYRSLHFWKGFPLGTNLSSVFLPCCWPRLTNTAVQVAERLSNLLAALAKPEPMEREFS